MTANWIDEAWRQPVQDFSTLVFMELLLEVVGKPGKQELEG